MLTLLDINDFSDRYQLSPSTARRLVRTGEVKAEKINGRYLIDARDADQWMSLNPYRAWAKVISQPDRPLIALNTIDTRALYICSVNHNVAALEARGKLTGTVNRLRNRGITIEWRWLRGSHPCYCLKDIIEVDLTDKIWRIGPHPFYQGSRR